MKNVDVSHCAGMRAAFRLHLEFGDRFFYGCVGSVLEIKIRKTLLTLHSFRFEGKDEGRGA
jgi:hypothetical protein